MPSEAGLASETSSAWITATSVNGSVPMTVAFAVVPSLKFTVIEPLSPAPATTWLLVRILPSLLSTMPDPEPAPELLDTFTFTTEGSTAWATFSTVPSWTTELLVDSKSPAVVPDVVAVEPSSVSAP